MSLSVILQYNSGTVWGNQSKKDTRNPKKPFENLIVVRLISTLEIVN